MIWFILQYLSPLGTINVNIRKIDLTAFYLLKSWWVYGKKQNKCQYSVSDCVFFVVTTIHPGKKRFEFVSSAKTRDRSQIFVQKPNRHRKNKSRYTKMKQKSSCKVWKNIGEKWSTPKPNVFFSWTHQNVAKLNPANISLISEFLNKFCTSEAVCMVVLHATYNVSITTAANGNKPTFAALQYTTWWWIHAKKTLGFGVGHFSPIFVRTLQPLFWFTLV